MPFIPRPVKPPARRALTVMVPEETATLLARYAEFLPSTREYVIVHALKEAYRRDKEFQGWLARTYPDTRVTERDLLAPQTDAPRSTPASAAPRAMTPALTDSRGERARS